MVNNLSFLNSKLTFYLFIFHFLSQFRFLIYLYHFFNLFIFLFRMKGPKEIQIYYFFSFDICWLPKSILFLWDVLSFQEDAIDNGNYIKSASLCSKLLFNLVFFWGDFELAFFPSWAERFNVCSLISVSP